MRRGEVFRSAESEVSSYDEVKFCLATNVTLRRATPREVSAHAEVKIASHPGRGGARSVTERAKEYRKITVSMRDCEYDTLSPDSVGSSPKGRANYAYA